MMLNNDLELLLRVAFTFYNNYINILKKYFV